MVWCPSRPLRRCPLQTVFNSRTKLHGELSEYIRAAVKAHRLRGPVKHRSWYLGVMGTPSPNGPTHEALVNAVTRLLRATFRYVSPALETCPSRCRHFVWDRHHDRHRPRDRCSLHELGRGRAPREAYHGQEVGQPVWYDTNRTLLSSLQLIHTPACTPACIVRCSRAAEVTGGLSLCVRSVSPSSTKSPLTTGNVVA